MLILGRQNGQGDEAALAQAEARPAPDFTEDVSEGTQDFALGFDRFGGHRAGRIGTDHGQAQLIADALFAGNTFGLSQNRHDYPFSR